MLLTVAWIEAPVPPVEQQMMMVHCSMHRARGIPSFGRGIEVCDYSLLRSAVVAKDLQTLMIT